jgi:hypothetical protein
MHDPRQTGSTGGLNKAGSRYGWQTERAADAVQIVSRKKHDLACDRFLRRLTLHTHEASAARNIVKAMR